MERERMRRLDQLIGTQTHFHEVAPYEERLDSQTVLERSIFKGQKYDTGKVDFYDPQKPRKDP